MQIKIALYSGAALVLWLLARNAKASPAPPIIGRVSKTLDINADVYSSDFGLPYIAGPGGPGAASPSPANNSNPAQDPTMRALIDKSNAAIAADNADTTITGIY